MDKDQNVILGVVLTLGFLLVLGVLKVGTTPSRVGGTPARDGHLRWPDEQRGRGTTSYNGGRLGVGVELGIGDDDALSAYDPGGPTDAEQRHRCHYPRRSGEVLEALMTGPCMVKPPIPWHERAWLFAPPATEA